MSAQAVRIPSPTKPAEAAGPPVPPAPAAASRARKKSAGAAAGAAAPTGAAGAPVGLIKTDSISTGIKRIVEAEKRADFNEVMHGSREKTPSERSHTDREMPGDGTSQAASQTLTQRAQLLEGGEKKLTPSAEAADDGGSGFPPAARSRLEEVIKDRTRSRKSWKNQQVENKKRAQLQAEANEDPAGQPGDSPDSPAETPGRLQTTDEPVVPAKSRSNRSGKRRAKSMHHTHSVSVREPVPTDSRGCVNPDYLALYDRLVADEKKEFESKCRSKITCKFLIIFAAFTVFFLAVSITFAVLYFNARKNK